MSVLEVDAEIRRLDVAAETARRFLESLANQERLNRTRDAVKISEQTVSVLTDTVNAGRTPKADLVRAETELARVRLDEEDLIHELKSSIRRLAAQWGETMPAFHAVQGDAFTLPGSVAFADLQARINQNPDLTRFSTEQHFREAELRLAQARARPNWRVTAGIRRFEQTNDQALVAGISIPLTTRNKNQGNIAKARANLAQNSAERDAELIRIETQLFAIHQEMEHSLHKARVLKEEIIPRSELALADTRTAYEQGRYRYSELRVVQAELISARMALIETSIDAHRYVIEIERLIGASLASLAARP
jgi:cobalt-zinc-cadmium efflux system outer membrane protein